MTAVFLELVNMSISAGWLVLAILAARCLLRKAPKWLTCSLWGLVAVRLVFPFSIESVFSLIPSAQTLPQDILTENRFHISSGVPVIDHQINDVVLDSYYEGVTVPTDNGIHIMSVLTLVWLAGMAALLLYAMVSYLRLRHKVSASLVLRENIYLCDYIGSPFILGILFPRIYLPSAMDEASRPHVIAHEMAHLKRGDHWWKPLGYGLLCLHWFNPLMWVAYILLCRDIELACDEKVIREMGQSQKKAYSEALLECSMPRHLIAACPLAFGETGVKERVRSVLNYKKPAFWVILIAVITCIAVAVCFLTDPVTEPDAPEAEFRAVVVESHPLHIVVQPEEGSTESKSASRIQVLLPDDAPDIRIGDTVRIIYDGLIQETYPAQITGATLVQVLNDLESLSNSYDLVRAILDGCVVMVDGDVVAGQDTWQSFADRAYAGQSASVRIVSYYTIGDPARMSAELFEESRDSYPRMYIRDLSYDGNTYTVHWFEDSTEYTRMWKYLMHYSGKPDSEHALYDSYDCYMLADRSDVTYNEIWSGVYSADFRDQIAFDQIYMDRGYDDEPTFRDLERAKEALEPYMIEYRIASLDANELTGRLDIVVYEWVDGLYALIGRYLNTQFVTVTEMRGTIEFTGDQTQEEIPATDPPGTYYRLSVSACVYRDPRSSGQLADYSSMNFVFDSRKQNPYAMFRIEDPATGEVLYTCSTENSQWEKLPISQERLTELLPYSDETLAGQLWDAQYRHLSDEYCLLLKDGTLYAVRGSFGEAGEPEYIRQVYELTVG